MYQFLLTRKYLFSKIMPLLAALAVMLCTATELIVWSVMGGFLNSLRDAGKDATGDVSIAWPVVGFPHYEELVSRLESTPEIEAAAPLIETLAVLNLPHGGIKPVELKGIDGPRYARVTNYADTIWWKPIDKPSPKDVEREDWRLEPLIDKGMQYIDFPDWVQSPEARGRFIHKTWEEMYQDGLSLSEIDAAKGDRVPAIVLGIEVAGYNRRLPGGNYIPGARYKYQRDGSSRKIQTFLPLDRLSISVVPIDTSGNIRDIETLTLPVANEVRSGFYPADSGVVYINFGALQDALGMDNAQAIDLPRGGVFRVDEERPVVGVSPARATTVLVKAAPGVHLAQAKMVCLAVYKGFADDHSGEVPGIEEMEPFIQTFADKNAMFIGAVEKEIVLVMFIFGVISFTSIFLVLAIFWAMISEKTRDIGVLRALGASRSGIASLWISYGLMLGVIGATAGSLIAWVIIHNINDIHDWLGENMNIQVWDPAVYVFAKIPNEVEPFKVAVIFTAGVLACVFGAAWPAVRASRMDPVKALRFE